MKDNVFIFFITTIIMFTLGFFVGLGVQYNKDINEAIKAGVGNYVVERETGRVVFKYGVTK